MEWINFKEEKPEENEWIYFTDSKMKYVGFVLFKENGDYIDFAYELVSTKRGCSYKFVGDIPITYWMPLPEPPEEE